MTTSIPYRHFSVERIGGAIGAEINGLDLSRPLAEEIVLEVKRALREHMVLVIRGQTLSPHQHARFASSLGPLTPTPFTKHHPDQPFVAPLIREADEARDVMNSGGNWHCDGAFFEEPQRIAVLYGVDIPPVGGDTMFANLCLGYDLLSDAMKEIAERLVVVYSGAAVVRGRPGEAKTFAGQKAQTFELTHDPDLKVEHPLVQFHPETGRRCLWISAPHAVGLKGMTPRESKPLLGFFDEHTHRPEATCRVRWTKGAVTMWDNRCVKHFAINDYGGFRREVHRVQIGGERPVGPATSPKLADVKHRATA